MKTWHVEAVVMGLILSGTVLLFGNSMTEWVGAGAVFMLTRRVSVADRMQESEEARDVPSTDCHRWFKRYLVAGEVLWTGYFLLHGAHSALVGVGLMLGYPVWRKIYRRWRPRTR